MKVRWIGEPRALAAPQVDVVAGDVVDVDDAAGVSLVAQGLAAPVEAASKSKKEND